MARSVSDSSPARLRFGLCVSTGLHSVCQEVFSLCLLLGQSITLNPSKCLFTFLLSLLYMSVCLCFPLPMIPCQCLTLFLPLLSILLSQALLQSDCCQPDLLSLVPMSDKATIQAETPTLGVVNPATVV